MCVCVGQLVWLANDEICLPVLSTLAYLFTTYSKLRLEQEFNLPAKKHLLLLLPSTMNVSPSIAYKHKMAANMNFTEGPRPDDPQSVWHYFLRSDAKPRHGKCKKCGNILKAEGGSTSGMWNHLKVFHAKDAPSNKINNTPDTTSEVIVSANVLILVHHLEN